MSAVGLQGTENAKKSGVAPTSEDFLKSVLVMDAEPLWCTYREVERGTTGNSYIKASSNAPSRATSPGGSPGGSKSPSTNLTGTLGSKIGQRNRPSEVVELPRTVINEHIPGGERSYAALLGEFDGVDSKHNNINAGEDGDFGYSGYTDRTAFKLEEEAFNTLKQKSKNPGGTSKGEEKKGKKKKPAGRMSAAELADLERANYHKNQGTIAEKASTLSTASGLNKRMPLRRNVIERLTKTSDPSKEQKYSLMNILGYGLRVTQILIYSYTNRR